MRKTIRDPPGKLTLKLKLIQLKRNIIFHPPPFLSSRLIIQGVYSFHDSLIPHDWDIRLDDHSAIPIRWLVKPRLSDYRSLTTRPASNKKGKHKYSYNHNICPKCTSSRIKDMIQVHPRKLTTLTWNLKKAPKGKGKNLQTHNFWGSMLVFGGAKGFSTNNYHTYLWLSVRGRQQRKPRPKGDKWHCAWRSTQPARPLTLKGMGALGAFELMVK